MPTDALPPILVIGRGRLGGSIAHAASELGLPITALGHDDAAGLAGAAESVLFCVPDAAIEPACADLIESGARPAFAGHTSGSLGLEALAPARAAGVATFCLHPLQTVPTPTSSLAGAPAAIDGSGPEALALARNLAIALGMLPFELPGESRAAYHAAASIASNLLIALEESAVELLDAAGIEDGRRLLGPLVARTAANWTADGAEALTGPIARGDSETVERHIAEIEALTPELLPLYEALADRAREIAEAGAKAPR